MKRARILVMLGVLGPLAACTIPPELLTTARLPAETSPPSEPPSAPSETAAMASSPPTASRWTLPRITEDRPDDTDAPQIHMLYVVPKDGVDLERDVDGSIAKVIARSSHWFAEEAQGRRLRFDTYQGKLDLTFVRLSQTEAELAAGHSSLLGALEKALRPLGFEAKNKRYGVYYEGYNEKALGLGGHKYAAVFLQYCRPCVFRGHVVPEPADPYAPWEDWGMTHELLHSLGAVPACAPHANAGAHTTDDKHDIMGGSRHPRRLDTGRDDYFDHGRPGCLDLAKSEYLVPAPPDWTPHPAIKTPEPEPYADSWIGREFDGERAVEESLAELILAERVKTGLHPMVIVEPLRHVAREHSRDMLENGYFGYDSPTWGGLGPAERVFRAGYYGDAGEALATTLVPSDTTTEALADILFKKLQSNGDFRGNLEFWARPALGVGIVRDGNTWICTIEFGRSAYETRALALTPGIDGGYTVKGEARLLPGHRAQDATVIVGGKQQQSLELPPAEWVPFRAEIPAGENVRVGFTYRQDTERALVYDGFRVDARKPLNDAIVPLSAAP